MPDIRRLIMAWLDANRLLPPHTDLTQVAIDALVHQLSKLQNDGGDRDASREEAGRFEVGDEIV